MQFENYHLGVYSDLIGIDFIVFNFTAVEQKMGAGHFGTANARKFNLNNQSSGQLFQLIY